MTPEELAILNWQAQNAYIQQQNAMQQQTQQQRQQQNRTDALSWEYQNAMNRANQANESRYADILQLLGVNRNNILGDISQWGESQVQDANQRYKEQAAAGVVDAYNRGFGGSPSVMNAARNQANRSRDAELARIRDNQIQQRVGAAERTTNNIAGVMERRNDVPPDLNQLIGLQRNLGQAGPLLGNPYPSSVAGTPGGGWGSQPGQVGLPRPAYGGTQPTTQTPAPYYTAALHGGNPFLGGASTGKMGTQQAMRPFIPLTMPSAPAFVGHTGYGEYRPTQQVPRNLSPGYNSGTAAINNQYTMSNGQYMPLVAPVQQQLPTVPGMVGTGGGGGGGGGYMPFPVYMQPPGSGHDNYSPTDSTYRTYGTPPRRTVRRTPMRSAMSTAAGAALSATGLPGAGLANPFLVM